MKLNKIKMLTISYIFCVYGLSTDMNAYDIKQNILNCNNINSLNDKFNSIIQLGQIQEQHVVKKINKIIRRCNANKLSVVCNAISELDGNAQKILVQKSVARKINKIINRCKAAQLPVVLKAIDILNKDAQHELMKQIDMTKKYKKLLEILIIKNI